MRTLKVKCPTWQHVETFYERKLRQDKTLTIRVPFQTEQGATIMLGLQLPDGMVMAIEGVVRHVGPASEGQRAAVQLQLHGLTDDVLSRLRALVADARGRETAARQAIPTPAPLPAVEVEPPDWASRAAPPVPLPEDVPISEPVEPPSALASQDLSQDGREIYDKLDTELQNLHECAAHEVLGVEPDADVAEVRRAYFACTKRYHPDLFARYRSPAVMFKAQEVFIHINRAYDRMRGSLMTAGRALIAGPALLPHDGWLLGLDDMVSGDGAEGGYQGIPGAIVDGPTGDGFGFGSFGDIELGPGGGLAANATAARGQAEKPGGEPLDALRAEIDGLVTAHDFEGARSRLADALHADPRNRSLRALYYVVSGKEALEGGDAVLAANQFEAALAHDKNCAEARHELDELRKRGKHRVFPRFVR